MADTTTASRRLFIEPDLRPDVTTHSDEVCLTVSTSATTTDIARAAEAVLDTEGYDSGVRRWDPTTFLGRVLVAKPDVQCTVLEGEAVILNLSNGHYYTVNPVGTVIWELIDGQRPLGAVLEQMCERFDVSRDRAHDDLVALVVRMEREGLLHEERR